MRVLIVTGRLAAGIVKRAAKRAEGCEAVDVYVADSDVATLIPVNELEKAVEHASRHGYDAVVIPGMHPADERLLASLSRRHGVKVFKGPDDASALPEALRRLCSEEPSLPPGSRIDAEPNPSRILEGLEPEKAYTLPCGMLLPVRPPPVMVWHEAFGEPPEKSPCHVQVLGLGEAHDWDYARGRLKRMLDMYDCVGVDSPRPKVLVKAARAGASILMSLHPGTKGVIDELPRGVAVVLIPAEPGKIHRLAPAERVDVLRSMAEKARAHGLVPVADPVVAPPLRGLASSVEAYLEAAKRLRDTPLLAGLGNIYELMDADSHGVIALSMTLFAEIGVSVMLVSEESWKARRAAEEAMVAAALASASMKLSSYPKNMGVDLLALKEKRPLTPYRPRQRGEVVNAWEVQAEPFRRDPAGDLYIYLEEGCINITRVRDGEVVETLRARSAEEAYRAAIARGMVSRLDHAAYLGKELAYAEQSLMLGRSYVQEVYGRIKHPWEVHGGPALSLLDALRARRPRRSTRQP